MKLKIVLVISTILFSSLSMANKLVQEQHFKDMKKTSMKCFVQLVGGNNSILYHYDLPVRDIKHFEERFKAFHARSNKSPENAIYKINECVQGHKRFKDNNANRMVERDKTEG